MQVASTIIRPDTGKIIALIGGKDYSTSQFNRVTSSTRQVGSTIKPFLIPFDFSTCAAKTLTLLLCSSAVTNLSVSDPISIAVYIFFTLSTLTKIIHYNYNKKRRKCIYFLLNLIYFYITKYSI